MRPTFNSIHRAPRAKLRATAAAMIGVISILGASVGSAQAQGTPVLPPSNFRIEVLKADVIVFRIDPFTGTKQYQLISGPNTAGSPIVNATSLITIDGLTPNSDYVVQVRNTFKGVFTEWVNFSFRTAADFVDRPNPPQNLRVVQTMATQVTVRWDAPAAGTFVYRATANGVLLPGPSCTLYVPCTNEQERTRTIARPAPGASVLFSVTARDTSFNTSVPAEITLSN